MTANSRGGSCSHLMEWRVEKDLWQTGFCGYNVFHPLTSDWFLRCSLRLSTRSKFLSAACKRWEWAIQLVDLSFSLHKLWQGTLRAKVAAICLCMLRMSLMLDSSNSKAPDSSLVRYHAVYICRGTNFQIKFLVTLYWLHPVCIYVVPLQLCHKHFIKFIWKHVQVTVAIWFWSWCWQSVKYRTIAGEPLQSSLWWLSSVAVRLAD